MTTLTGKRFPRLPSYRLKEFRQDLIAGISVAVIAIPQSMAYALIAGVPAQYGLYTVIIQSIIGVLVTSTWFLSLGPTNTQSLLVASVATSIVTELAPDERGELYLRIVLGLTLFKGVVQLILATARMGLLIKYVSRSVIVGFMAGAGVLIVAGQIPNFLGLDLVGTSSPFPGLLGMIDRIIPHVNEITGPSLFIGVTALAIVLGSRLVSRFVPGPLLAVVLTALLVWLCGWTNGQTLLIGELPSAWPRFNLPDIRPGEFKLMLEGALALSVLGLFEAYSISKSLAIRTGLRVTANRELRSQGLISLFSAFLSCIPGSGSLSRTALNVYAGAATRLAGGINGLIVFTVFLLFSPLARYIPLASLAAILFVIAYGLIDWRFIRYTFRANRADALVCAITFIATLTVPLQYAIFVGVFLNISLYLRQASQLELVEMVPQSDGSFSEEPLRVKPKARDVVFLQMEGDMFFGIADEFQDRLADLLDSEARVVIFRLKRVHSVDSSILGLLERFIQSMQERGGTVLLCGVRATLMRRLERCGLIDCLGAENVFETTAGVFTSAKKAMERADFVLHGFCEDHSAEWRSLHDST